MKKIILSLVVFIIIIVSLNNFDIFTKKMKYWELEQTIKNTKIDSMLINNKDYTFYSKSYKIEFMYFMPIGEYYPEGYLVKITDINGNLIKRLSSNPNEYPNKKPIDYKDIITELLKKSPKRLWFINQHKNPYEIQMGFLL